MSSDKQYESPTLKAENRAKHRRLRFLTKRALRLKKKCFPRSMRRYVIR